MALTLCNECERKVSTYAKYCPHCGCPSEIAVKKREPIGERAIVAAIRGDLEQPKGGVGLPTDFRNRVNLPKRTKQAKLYRIYGWAVLVGGLIGILVFAQQNEEKAIQFAVIIVVIASSCFLTAFLIDVLTDMRHYLRAIAEKE